MKKTKLNEISPELEQLAVLAGGILFNPVTLMVAALWKMRRDEKPNLKKAAKIAKNEEGKVIQGKKEAEEVWNSIEKDPYIVELMSKFHEDWKKNLTAEKPESFGSIYDLYMPKIIRAVNLEAGRIYKEKYGDDALPSEEMEAIIKGWQKRLQFLDKELEKKSPKFMSFKENKMKQSELKSLIREEIKKTLKENGPLMSDPSTKSKVEMVINTLRGIDVDGETMQYILKQVGMEEQMLHQLTKGGIR